MGFSDGGGWGVLAPLYHDDVRHQNIPHAYETELHGHIDSAGSLSRVVRQM